MMEISILIKNATILTMTPEREEIKKGFIAINGSTIIDLGKMTEVDGRYAPEIIIDASGKLVLPGFINTHHHLYSTYFKGSPYMHGEGDLFDFLRNIYTPNLINASREDCYNAAMLGCVEMIRSGITSTIDVNGWASLDATKAVLDAFDHVGIRGTEARLVVDRDPLSLGLVSTVDVWDAVDETIELIEKWKDHGRIRVWFHPTMPHQCSDELLVRIGELSQELDIGFSIHLHEEKDEVADWIERYGLSPIKYYYQNEIDVLNDRNIATHCVWLDEDEIEILAKTNTPVSHNAVINLHSAGIAPVPKMLAAGIVVGLGTDDAFGDMFEVMKTTALIHKLPAGDSSVILPEKILEMATFDGAKVMRLDHIVGSIEVGKKADLVVLDMEHPNTIPTTDPLSYMIVYCAKSQNVDTVIIDGEVVLEKGNFTNINEKEIMDNAQKSMRAIHKRD